MSNELHYRQVLQHQFELRCRKNGQYSLRAFARDLGMVPSRVSDILHGKQGLSNTSASQVAKRLGMSDRETVWFVTDEEKRHGRSRVQRLAAERTQALLQDESRYRQLDEKLFTIVSEWYHFALLELTTLVQFKPQPQWIAAKLGISRAQAEQAIRRLLECGLLEKTKHSLVATTTFPVSPSGVPSQAVKAFHAEILEKADEALYLQRVEERDFSATTLAVNTEDIPEIKEELKKIRRKLEAKYKARPAKNAVYCLSTQFFSLTKNQNGVPDENAN